MAAEKYYIKDAITKPAIHHESFQKLWETKWKKPCGMGVYPFMFGTIQDFEPVVEEIIKKDMKEPYDWDAYARMWFPKAEELAARAAEAEKAGENEKASELYLRSSAVYRMARFPTARCEKAVEAWEVGKKVFYHGQSLLEHPIKEVLIPHTHGIEGEGKAVPVNYLRAPGASADSPAPCLMIVTGLDGYRTELAVWQHGWLSKGVSTIVVEIPGTGDSPALRQDPTSPDRQWSSVLDWIDAQPELDSKKIIVWGFSTGGYYTLRLAHTHKDRVMACISLGGGAHHMFDREWLENVNHLEYPFPLTGTLAWKFGYGDDQQAFIADAPKFSLLNDGTLDKPCAKMLLVNGMNDEIFPIDDCFVAMQHGGPKLARLVANEKHMGEPDSFFIIITWIFGMYGIKGHFSDIMKTLMRKAKY